MRRRIIEVTVAVALLALAAGAAAAQCIGDANNNGFVNFADYGAVAQNFGQSCEGQPYCGNGMIDVGEACDQGSVGANNCQNEGFAGGTIKCGPNCSVDTSGCWNERFVDNEDGTISDLQTGLMWEKKVKRDSVSDFANPHDADNSYYWSCYCAEPSSLCQPDAASESACVAGVEGDPSKGCTRQGSGGGSCPPNRTVWQWVVGLNASAFAGYSDWRLPTANELQGLLAVSGSVRPYCTRYPCTPEAFHGESCGANCGDLSASSCSCTAFDGSQVFYWTASDHVRAPTYALGVGFAYVEILERDYSLQQVFQKYSELKVRAVRRGN